jgi:hypothetical protein
MEAPRGTWLIDPTHFWSRHWMGVSGQRHGKGPWYPLYSRLGGPHSRSGHRGLRKSPLPEIEHPSSGLPVRCQTLCWLSYPGSSLICNMAKFLPCVIIVIMHIYTHQQKKTELFIMQKKLSLQNVSSFLAIAISFRQLKGYVNALFCR